MDKEELIKEINEYLEQNPIFVKDLSKIISDFQQKFIEKAKLSNNANLRTNLEFLLSTNLDKKIVGKLNKTGILIVLFSMYEVFKLNGNKYPYEEKYTYDFFRKYSITRDLEFEKERFKDNEEFINFVDVMCFKSKQENEKR